MRLVPAGAYQLRNPSGLPLVLQGVISQATGNGEAWICFTDGTHTWLFTAEMSLPLSRECGAPVLAVTAYTGEGDPQDEGDWTLDVGGNWRRCAD